jgi:hypothetical protein
VRPLLVLQDKCSGDRGRQGEARQDVGVVVEVHAQAVLVRYLAFRLADRLGCLALHLDDLLVLDDVEAVQLGLDDELRLIGRRDDEDLVAFFGERSCEMRNLGNSAQRAIEVEAVT